MQTAEVRLRKRSVARGGSPQQIAIFRTAPRGLRRAITRGLLRLPTLVRKNL